MSGIAQLETVILLLIAVLALTAVARRLLVPYPIVLVLGGLALGLAPGLPPVTLAPDLVFLVFLPPILWSAAYFTSFRDFKANLRPISLLALGLVLATTGVVAVAAHWSMPGLPWPAAVTLGAIVSPSDAVAATAIARKLRIPHRVVTILEGESLVNDASALIVYRAAVAAAAGGGFVLADTLGAFVVAAAGGVAIGVGVGFLAIVALRRIESDSLLETAITLLAPYIAWVVAAQADTSAVLACVAGGLYLRREFSGLVAPLTRIQARAVWELLVFLLNGVIFILIGLQLRTLRDAATEAEVASLAWPALAVSLACIVVRLVWVPLAAAIPRWLSPSLRARDTMPPRSVLFLIGWTGMRGIVSLAAALGLPADFPHREAIVLITFAVILATLVVQGLTLAPIIRALRLPEDDTLAREEAQAREAATAAALARIEALAVEPWAHPAEVERARMRYAGRRRLFSQIGSGGDPEAAEAAAAFRRLRHATLQSEREALIRLRDEGVIGDEVLHRLEYELDVEALRLGTGDLRG